MNQTFSRICVFCGSAAGRRPEYTAAARELGGWLGANGVTLVYGGGRTGLMGAVAEATMAAGGQAIGIIPKPLVDKEVAHLGLTELRVVASMHERKAAMAELADAFIVLPGGYGTFDEFCEILTWSQLMFHSKPCGLWNVAGYWDPMIAMFDHAAAEGFVRAQHRRIPLFASSLTELLAAMAAQIPALRTRDPKDKWWESP
jgi:hypothetical protein